MWNVITNKVCHMLTAWDPHVHTLDPKMYYRESPALENRGTGRYLPKILFHG